MVPYGMKGDSMQTISVLTAMALVALTAIGKQGELLSSEWRIEGELVDHDALTSWLWTYREGRWWRYW